MGCRGTLLSRGRSRGFTLVELAVVVIIVAIAGGLALERLLPLIARAERIAFLQVQGQLKSALRLEAAERITRGESATLQALELSNPMVLLLEPPANYRGAFSTLGMELERASWYFDDGRGRLVYRVGKHAAFESLEGPPEHVELEVRFAYRDRDGNGRYDAGRDTFDGLALETVTSYLWND